MVSYEELLIQLSSFTLVLRQAKRWFHPEARLSQWAGAPLSGIDNRVLFFFAPWFCFTQKLVSIQRLACHYMPRHGQGPHQSQALSGIDGFQKYRMSF